MRTRALAFLLPVLLSGCGGVGMYRAAPSDVTKSFQAGYDQVLQASLRTAGVLGLNAAGDVAGWDQRFFDELGRELARR